MDSLAALVADRNGDKHDPIEVADLLDAMGDRASTATGETLHDAADVVRALAAALRPYLAPAGLEAFEGLKKLVADGFGGYVVLDKIDSCCLAHAAALAEVAELRAQAAALTPDPEVLAAAGEVLKLERHGDRSLTDKERMAWLAPRLAAWVAERGSK